MQLRIDFETRSLVDLRKCGLYRYAEDPSTEIQCMAWAFGDEDPALWWPGDPFPERIWAHVLRWENENTVVVDRGGEIRAWNAAFERIMWRDVGVPRYGFPPTRLEQFVDTAAEAAAMALPRSLAQCAAALRLNLQKDAGGQRLMLQMCRPRRIESDGTVVWWTEAAKLQRLGEYCQQDVRVERRIESSLHRLRPDELELYWVDQHINDRGLLLDVPTAQAAKFAAEAELDRQSKLLSEVTNGAVERVTRVGRLKEWIREQGVEVDSLAKAPVRALLADNQLPADVLEALKIRAESAKSSVAKLNTMLDWACRDGRLRGMFLFHGASTGRWAGKGPQPHNFPRPTCEPDEIELTISRLLRGTDGTETDIPSLFDISNILRSLIVAPPGEQLTAGDYASDHSGLGRLTAGDYSGIELRVNAWQANDQTLLTELRSGASPYCNLAARILLYQTGEAVAPESIKKGSNIYQLGKAAVLGCGFGMGGQPRPDGTPGKFRRTVKEKLDLEIDDDASTLIVNTFREHYPQIVTSWTIHENAALDAVSEPGVVQRAGVVKYLRRDGYLYCILPSRRPLCYASPKIEDKTTWWGAVKPTVTFLGTNTFRHQWERMSLYGGLQVENVVQAISRDLLAAAVLRFARLGAKLVGTVHDEIIVEDWPSTLGNFLEIMTTLPSWAGDCPVAAEGWMARRYQK